MDLRFVIYRLMRERWSIDDESPQGVLLFHRRLIDFARFPSPVIDRLRLDEIDRFSASRFGWILLLRIVLFFFLFKWLPSSPAAENRPVTTATILFGGRLNLISVF